MTVLAPLAARCGTAAVVIPPEPGPPPAGVPVIWVDAAFGMWHGAGEPPLTTLPQVDDERLRFLFGTVPGAGDYADEDGRIALLHADRPDADAGWPPPSIRVVIANQVLDGDPPGTWATALRLLGLGLDRKAVMDQLVGAVLPQIEAVLRGAEVDRAGYEASLERLPAPSPAALRAAYLDIVREERAVSIGRLTELAAAPLGVEVVDPAWFAAVEAELLLDPVSPVTMAHPDVVVHVPALVDGIVLTHRLSAAEHAADHLDLDADLGAFLRFPAPRVPQGPLVVDDMVWAGPVDWLAPLPLDALLAVRVTGEGAVTVEVLEEEPVAAPGLVELLRSVYDTEVAEPGLPVTAEMLVVGMLLRDPDVFTRPMPPLTELAAAAGLERREGEFAHDESVWAAGTVADRQFRVLERLETPEQRDAALAALELLGTADPAGLRRALDLLGDPEVLLTVLDELLDEHDRHDGERVAALAALGARLVTAAGRSPRAAVAGFVAATAAERDGRVLDAESHLRAGSAAAEGWWLVEDRLAAYESDRGDAAAALGRWQSVEAREDGPDVAAVRPFAVAAGPEPGRNDPCWCGSGRKYKQCHRGQRAAAPLAERVGWLHRKAVGYLERRGGTAADLLDEYAETLAGDDGDLDAAYDEPVVADAVLHEGGWFARFLAERGPLLPADERELGASWLAVERGVYEVVEPTHIRDVRTGEQRATAGPLPAVGARILARALPDGAGRHVLVGVVAVARDLEEELLAVLEERDGFELLDLLGAGPPPPRQVLRSAPPRPAPAAAPSAAVSALQERRERRWCDDASPELDGLTPREAAADPARRDTLERLLAALPVDDPATGRLGLRSDRIRGLLGLV
jgi:hypothetical protein